MYIIFPLYKFTYLSIPRVAIAKKVVVLSKLKQGIAENISTHLRVTSVGRKYHSTWKISLPVFRKYRVIEFPSTVELLSEMDTFSFAINFEQSGNKPVLLFVNAVLFSRIRLITFAFSTSYSERICVYRSYNIFISVITLRNKQTSNLCLLVAVKTWLYYNTKLLVRLLLIFFKLLCNFEKIYNF